MTAISTTKLTRIFGGGTTFTGRHRPAVHALLDVSLDVAEGDTLGIVGETGCGKSTLARLLVGLDEPTSGTIRLGGKEVRTRGRWDRRERARQIQYVFQDPGSSLNPRKTLQHALEAPLRRLVGLDAGRRRERLAELMEAVGLRRDFLPRYPHELSGGQAQRVAIARALAAEARYLVLDEPVSALDVSVQAQVLTLLSRLREQLGLTYLFISHDLSVVESVSDKVAVMYFGRVVELGDRRHLFQAPRHPYTELLLRSAPRLGQRHIRAETKPAELPDPTNPPAGCAFANRCPRRLPKCRTHPPALEGGPTGTLAACWNPLPSADAETLSSKPVG